jgi:hypothetical protein
MAQRSRSAFHKLKKEKSRQQKRKDKEAKRADARQRKASRDVGVSGEDPDFAGIKPGPQPLPEQWEYVKKYG